MPSQEWDWTADQLEEPPQNTDLKQFLEFVGTILAVGVVLGLLAALAFLLFT